MQIKALLPRHRPTVRLRLTVLYGALFLLTGALLQLTSYMLIRRDLDQALAPPATAMSLAQYRHSLRQQLIQQVLAHSAMGWGMMAVVSIWLAWWAAGRALRPVQQVTATARRLSETSLHERIGLTGPRDELREMAEIIDAMLDRLEAAFEGQRRFVANASHELRTPLTIQRTLAEVALDNPEASAGELRGALQEVVAVTARSQRLIDNLLVLARSARGLTPQEKREIDLAAVTRQAIDQEWRAAGRPALALTSRLDPACVDGVPALLAHLVANLVQNAIRHNHAGGWVEVVTEASDDLARLIVRNSGPVVPPDRTNAIFEPFTRLGADRTGPGRGSGLGLSIVRAVAERHDASVMAVALPTGGLAVTATFRVARSVRGADKTERIGDVLGS